MSALLLLAPKQGAGSAGKPTYPPNVHHALGTPVWYWRGSSFRVRHRLQQARQQRESSERSHGMIKGKWRIDLGGKIKGAKSVALGSAVTKRGQDNSLQMCERCKYQVGGGEAARRARGPGRGLVRPLGGLDTPGRLRIRAGPSPGVVRGRRARGVGKPQVPNRGSPSGAQLRESGADLHVQLPPRVGSEVAGSYPISFSGCPSSPGPLRLLPKPPAAPAEPPLRAPAPPSGLASPRPSPGAAGGGRQCLPPRWKPLALLCAEVTLPRSREPGECK